MYHRPSVTITSGQSVSDVGVSAGGAFVGIVMPAAWTAANLTFQASHDGATYKSVYDDAGAEFVVTAAADRYIELRTAVLQRGYDSFKVRSGTAGTPVNQAAQRQIQLVFVEQLA